MQGRHAIGAGASDAGPRAVLPALASAPALSPLRLTIPRRAAPLPPAASSASATATAPPVALQAQAQAPPPPTPQASSDKQAQAQEQSHAYAPSSAPAAGDGSDVKQLISRMSSELDRVTRLKENQFRWMQRRWIDELATFRREIVNGRSVAQASSSLSDAGAGAGAGAVAAGPTDPLSSPVDLVLVHLEAAISHYTPFEWRGSAHESAEAACRRIATPIGRRQAAEGSMRGGVFASLPVGRLQDQRSDIADLLRRYSQGDSHCDEDLPSGLADAEERKAEEKQPLVSKQASSGDQFPPPSRLEQICAPPVAADDFDCDTNSSGWARAPSRRHDGFLFTWWSAFLCPWFGAHVQARMSLEGFLCYSLLERAYKAGGALGELKVQPQTLQDAFHFWLTAAVLQPLPASAPIEAPPAEGAKPSQASSLGADAQPLTADGTRITNVPLPEPLIHMSLHRVMLRARFDQSLCAMSVSSRHRTALANYFFAGCAQTLPMGRRVQFQSGDGSHPAPLTFSIFLRRWLRLHHLHGVVLHGEEGASTAPSAEPSMIGGRSRGSGLAMAAVVPLDVHDHASHAPLSARLRLNYAQIDRLHAYGALQRGLLRCSSLSLHSNLLLPESDAEAELAANNEWSQGSSSGSQGVSGQADGKPGAVVPVGASDASLMLQQQEMQMQLFPALTPSERAVLWFVGMMLMPMGWLQLQNPIGVRWQRSGLRRWLWSQPTLLRWLGAGSGSSLMEIVDKPAAMPMGSLVFHLVFLLVVHACWVIMLIQLSRFGTDTYAFRSTRVPYFFFLAVNTAVAMYAAYAAYVPLPTRRVRLLHRVPVEARCEIDRPVGSRLPNLASVIYHLELQGLANCLDTRLRDRLAGWQANRDRASATGGADRAAAAAAAARRPRGHLWPHVYPYCSSHSWHVPLPLDPSLSPAAASTSSSHPAWVLLIELAILAWLIYFSWPHMAGWSDQGNPLLKPATPISIAAYYNSTIGAFVALPADPCTATTMGPQRACPSKACFINYQALTAVCERPMLLWVADWCCIALMVLVCCICGWIGPQLLRNKSTSLLEQLQRFNALAEPLHPLSYDLSLPLHKSSNLHAWLLLREYYKDMLRSECALQDRLFAPQMIMWLASCIVILCAVVLKAAQAMIFYVLPLMFFMSITMLIALYSVYTVNLEFEQAAHALQQAKRQLQEKRNAVIDIESPAKKSQSSRVDPPSLTSLESFESMGASLDSALEQLAHEIERGDDGYKVFGVVITANVMKGLVGQAVITAVLAIGDQIFGDDDD